MRLAVPLLAMAMAMALSAQPALATPSDLATPLTEPPAEQAVGALSAADVTETPMAALNAEAPIVPAPESLANDVAESMPIMTAQADDPARISLDSVPAAPIVVPAAGDRQAPSAPSEASYNSEDTADPRDPFESLNRQIFAVNMALDEALVLPVARAYEQHVPQLLQTGLRNMMSNLLDPYIAANSLLQGKPLDAASDLARFAVNTTVGVLGIADPATELGLQKHREDFGQTLGVWGVPPGPYVMLPLFGPSTVRDTVGFVVDVFGALLARFKNTEVRYSLASLEFLQQRVRALPAQQFLDEAFDPYLLIRNGYLQRRTSLIYDGDPPTAD